VAIHSCVMAPLRSRRVYLVVNSPPAEGCPKDGVVLDVVFDMFFSTLLGLP
jgi:hypothetical protein